VTAGIHTGSLFSCCFFHFVRSHLPLSPLVSCHPCLFLSHSLWSIGPALSSLSGEEQNHPLNSSPPPRLSPVRLPRVALASHNLPGSYLEAAERSRYIRAQ
jgi:hypothetical protein